MDKGEQDASTHGALTQDAPIRDALTPVSAAIRRRCPRCGQGRLLEGYLQAAPECDRCGLDFRPYEAGDAPAFFVTTLVCALAVSVTVWLQFAFEPPFWASTLAGVVVAALLALILLPGAKAFMIAQAYASGVGKEVAGSRGER